MMPEITVILPTYRPGDYIFECLDSLVNQTVNGFSFEIVVVLNGEKQPYYDAINSYLTKNCKRCDFSLLFSEIGSVSNARNIGLDVAKGNFIVFIDDDDIVSNDYLEGLYSQSKSNGIVFSNVLNFEDTIKAVKEDWLTSVYKKNKLKTTNTILNYRRHMSFVWGKLICKNVIANYRFDTKFVTSEDAIYMALISKNISFYETGLETAIYYRRQRIDSASRKKRKINYYLYNTFNAARAFILIYLSAPLKYNLVFFASRLLAVFRRLIYVVK